jgi:hypothetical protein
MLEVGGWFKIFKFLFSFSKKEERMTKYEGLQKKEITSYFE